jgi:hypothetical protein
VHAVRGYRPSFRVAAVIALVFQFADGTASVHRYQVHFGRLDCHDPLPEPFRDAIGAAVG